MKRIILLVSILSGVLSTSPVAAQFALGTSYHHLTATQDYYENGLLLHLQYQPAARIPLVVDLGVGVSRSSDPTEYFQTFAQSGIFTFGLVEPVLRVPLPPVGQWGFHLLGGAKVRYVLKEARFLERNLLADGESTLVAGQFGLQVDYRFRSVDFGARLLKVQETGAVATGNFTMPVPDGFQFGVILSGHIF